MRRARETPITAKAFAALTIQQFLTVNGALAAHIPTLRVLNPPPRFFADIDVPLQALDFSSSVSPFDIRLLCTLTGRVETIYPSGEVVFSSPWSIRLSTHDPTLGAHYNSALQNYFYMLFSYMNDRGIKTPLPEGAARSKEVLRTYCVPNLNTLHPLLYLLFEKE